MYTYFSRRRDSGEDYVEHVLHVELGSVYQLFRSQGPGDKGIQVVDNVVHKVSSQIHEICFCDEQQFSNKDEMLVFFMFL